MKKRNIKRIKYEFEQCIRDLYDSIPETDVVQLISMFQSKPTAALKQANKLLNNQIQTMNSWSGIVMGESWTIA